MFRAFQTTLDATGKGIVPIENGNTSKEWDIYQISCKTLIFVTACQVEIQKNGFFLCASPQGSLDTAEGPPDIVLQATDDLTVTFVSGAPHDQATVGIWYNENTTGTTVSTSH